MYSPFSYYVEDGVLIRTSRTNHIKPAKVELTDERILQFIREQDEALWAARHHHTELEKKHEAMTEKIEAALYS
jgi:hypothetical protein